LRILVVDDERDIADLVAYNLEKADFEVSKAYDGLAGWRALERDKPAVVVLDVMMPGMDGLEFCRRLRAQEDYAATRVLMLTARGSESDRVLGLELGADDYLVKPFSSRELVARVRALIRRSDAKQSEREIHEGALTLNPSTHEAKLRGKVLALTALEFRLLYYFASRPGRVLGRETLLTDIWGLGQGIETRTVDVHVRRLRQKMAKDQGMIATLRGVGYKFMREPK